MKNIKKAIEHFKDARTELNKAFDVSQGKDSYIKALAWQAIGNLESTIEKANEYLSRGE